MFRTDGDTIRVDVPVGQLLAAPREIELSVDRAEGAPLAVRLRLIPASASVGPTRHTDYGGGPEPMLATTTYAGRTGRMADGEGLDHEEYGAGD